jgi:hypothetical protein
MNTHKPSSSPHLVLCSASPRPSVDALQDVPLPSLASPSAFSAEPLRSALARPSTDYTPPRKVSGWGR